MLVPNRRDFLKTAAAVPLLAKGANATTPNVSCIFLMLVGGPSQLDTWDPKPGAPSHIRGPYKPIRTNVPGIEISEIFPRMARHADKYALIRSCYHSGEPVHDIGLQLMQTGRVFEDGIEHPHIGCGASVSFSKSPEAPPNRRRAAKIGCPTGGLTNGETPWASVSLPPCPRHVLLPGPIGPTGGNMPNGQTAGYLGAQHDPCILRPPSSTNNKYGRNRFGQSCYHALQLIEAGTRFVTINMFETVFNQITWDIHGSAPFSPLSCYRDRVGPMFDMAYSALLEDLHDRGILDKTLVVATGEFGRTPRINPAGGRDHWTQCWTMLMAGGGVQGGQIIGSSDTIGAEPKDRPVSPQEVAATIYHALGIDHTRWVDPGTRPVLELFG